MKRSLVLAAISSMVMTGSVATAQKCAHDELIHAAINSSPAKKAAYEQYERELNDRVQAFEQQQNANSASKTTASKYVIPVVFHVMLTQAQLDAIGGTSGMYSRIQTQMSVLNTDYNALNTETIPGAFAPLKGNPDITFGLAHTAPNGKGTIGYELVIKPASFTGFDVGDGAAKKTANGGLDPWDNKKYLNIWIFNITGASSGKVLGYAYNPALASAMGDANLMGVCVDYQAYGRRTSSLQNFYASADRGRTMVHELGHYFTLNHIWGNTPVGSGSCSDDDGVSDTPAQSDANQTTCPTFPKANCTGSTPGEMFMNYMDYVNDACMSMFSKGQVTRMQADLTGSGGSATLPNNTNLLSWPTGIAATEMQENLNIVPNPSNGAFTITYQDYIKSITIVNMMGQPVKQIAGNDQQSGAISVDMTGMSKGLYTVQCQYMEGVVSRKIVIE
eukprot:TRINITY_DN19253_c0_g1_i1.p1 TRINITY_DN19253_c0_g1~~TRINITY_DN19253_c0_g1_i1.p1  ORF type:complete len:447 (-),score=48.51 TRINITY_DN19253_c0_g1_i1:161-1501(-)